MKKRNTKFYKNEPNVSEIEHRLKNVLAYIDEGNTSKAKGGVKGVWYTLTQMAENLQGLLSDIDYDLETLRVNIARYKDEQYIDDNEAQSAMDNVLEEVAKMKPYLNTAARYRRSEKYSDDELEKAWGLMYEHLREKTIEDFDWRGRGYSESEIEELINKWFIWINYNPPMGTKMKYVKGSNIIYIPIYSREHRDEFAGYIKDMEGFLTDYFKEAVEIEEVYKY